jgi:hypothetical protein
MTTHITAVTANSRGDEGDSDMDTPDNYDRMIVVRMKDVEFELE